MAPKRRKCPICGSKRWHKEPSSGLVACSEGHILQNYRNETTEITEVGPHAMKKRTLKSGKEKKVKMSKRDPKLYHGARARTHYFICLQLILRKQIKVLIELWGLPDEFEVICKDLWTLHIASLANPIPEPEPGNEAGNEAGNGGDGDGDAYRTGDQMKEKLGEKEKEKEIRTNESDEGEHADKEDREVEVEAEGDGDHETPIQGDERSAKKNKGKQKQQGTFMV
ncbi:hypothetical protein CPB83DRAFT_324010 [Crepidotus variabilis]|uniref:Rrn7/TAF1B N-terminal cyclin domain-containing protein n=1 Tax=Crepidotus variabilis TaxID=179855 RepID=A0A9P6ESJ6_9AGAR|nr:hypothetical protein CPB83DRAFT_324010 [Crepidotus variabilis]